MRVNKSDESSIWLCVSNEYYKRSSGFSNVIDDDFLLLKEADSFLALEDDPTSSEVDPTYQDPEGDILLLEAILNSEPPHPYKSRNNILPAVRKETQTLIWPPHYVYAFLDGDDKLPVIIAKNLKDEEKAALLKVLKSHKRAIAWKLSDIKGVSPEFCTHKILMEEDYETNLCTSPWAHFSDNCPSYDHLLEKRSIVLSEEVYRKVQLEEINEHFRDLAYENSLNLKEKTKRIIDAKIKNRIFNDFPDCEDSRACSIHKSFTSSASFWESSIQI
ncbi:hypothetical protein Tco_0704796 [Tanacetum coccineum]|uniref:Reverse transcriptase domain-containing protein n=1 Tax=Tanacetum coccineum TaxID=301880 RepID=A0ABQ4Y2P8_9ASTR